MFQDTSFLKTLHLHIDSARPACKPTCSKLPAGVVCILDADLRGGDQGSKPAAVTCTHANDPGWESRLCSSGATGLTLLQRGH